jgi:hypothetical protein
MPPRDKARHQMAAIDAAGANDGDRETHATSPR